MKRRFQGGSTLSLEAAPRHAMVPVFVTVAVLMLSGTALPLHAESQRHAIPTVDVRGVPGGRGEVALFDGGGRIVKRYIGLGLPAGLLPARGRNFYVADRAAGAVLELTSDGETVWSFTDAEHLASVVGISAVPGGGLLLACGERGLIEVDQGGRIVWEIPSPEPNVDVTGAVRLAGGTTVLTLRHRQHSLYRVFPGSTRAIEVTAGIPDERRNFPRCAPLGQGGTNFLLWDNSWSRTYRCSMHDAALVAEASLPVSHAWWTYADDGGTLYYTLEAPRFCRWNEASGEVCWRTVFRPSAVIPAGDGSGQLVSYVRIDDAVWDGSWPLPPNAPRIDWARFWSWVGAGAVATTLLTSFSWWWGRRRSAVHCATTATGKVVDPVAATSEVISRAAADQRRKSVVGEWRGGFRFAALAGAVLGVGATARGHMLLTAGFAPGWLSFYLGGALLAALCLEAWRRFGLRERDPYWAAMGHSVPDLSEWPAIVLGSLTVAGGCYVLFGWRNLQQHYTDQIGLWVALVILLLGMCLGSPPARQVLAKGWRRSELLSLTIALAVGAVTIGYRLRQVPANIHFDYVFYALEGWKLLHGYYRDIWENGFVPAPAIGLVPEFVGLSLFGMGELGIRFGAALYGLSGIFAVYLLGRCYRDSETGFLAALFLAGSIPYMHFSRVPGNGEPATAALWVITGFAAALRYGHPSLWILTGLAAGYTFYLHPLARPPLVACVGFGLLVLLRSGRVVLRRWFGPLLLLTSFAVLLVPVIPLWLRNPTLIFPRVEESMTVFKPSEGVDWATLSASLGDPFWRSLGWFFVVPDMSSQGTLSPGCNAVEAVLLAVGVCVAAIEGVSLNLLFLGYVFLVLLTCGAWGVSPPWYTRLVSTAPIAAVLMARTLVGFHAFVPRRWRQAFLAFLVVGVILASPGLNLRRYVQHESGATGGYRLREMTAIGRQIRALGPEYRYYLVSTHNPSWTVDPRGGASFGELLPYIWGRQVREVRELDSVLPFPSGQPVALILQPDRITEDGATIRSWYPDAEVREIHGYYGERLAAFVLIHPAGPPDRGSIDD